MRYRFAELRKEWNRLAKDPAHKISGRSGYHALKEEAREAAGRKGRREIEMPSHHTRSGHAELISF